MHSLYQFIPYERRARVLLLMVVFASILMVSLNIAGKSLNTVEAPFGIISFELAGSVSRANPILDSWDQHAKMQAAFSLGLDFLFIPAYAFVISLGCIMAGEALCKRKWPLALVGLPLAWIHWFAALLDVIENTALLNVLFGSVVAPYPKIARWCAIPKFTIVFVGLVFVIYGGVVALTSRVSGE